MRPFLVSENELPERTAPERKEIFGRVRWHGLPTVPQQRHSSGDRATTVVYFAIGINNGGVEAGPGGAAGADGIGFSKFG